MMFAGPLHQFVPIAVERTLDSIIGGVVLSAAGWTWLRVARRQNSASRFVILFILLIGIALLPVAGLSWMAAPHAAASGIAAHSLITLPENAAVYLFLAWAVIAFAGLMRIAVGFRQLRKLQRNCLQLADEKLDAKTRTALTQSQRSAVLCISEQVQVPTALGFARPARIVIPVWLMDQLSPDELHHLVLHELAHLRRWDDWSNLAQKVLGALLFFHPAVWWLDRRLALEREMACDEHVLAATGNARAYAKSLASIAERSFVRRTIALAQAAVSRLHDTTLRVSKILSPATSRKPANPVPLLASATMAGGLILAAVAFSPDLVSFAAPVAPAPQTASVFTPPANLKPAMAATASSAESAAPKQILASLPVRRTARPTVKSEAMKQSHANAVAIDRTEAPDAFPAEAANRSKQAGTRVIPAKATLDKKHNETVTHPAVLIFWQETYDDGAGNVIQRSFWRVVVLANISKEQPKRI